MNQAADIMREHFQQDFIDLRNVRSAAHRVPERALDRGEGRFRIRALVVCLQEFLAVHDEVAEESVPSLGWRSGFRVALERNERLRALADRQFQVRVGAIRLVAHDAEHVELLRGLRDKRHEIRRVLRVSFRHLNGRDHVGFDAADCVDLNPIVFSARPFRPVLFLLPQPDKLRAGKARGVDGKVGFYRTERDCRTNNQVADDRRDRLGFKATEQRVVMRRLGDESLALRIANRS
jgi:hypothetical protein